MSAVGRKARRAAKNMANTASAGATWLQQGAGNAAAVAQAGIEPAESWLEEGADTIWDWLHGEEETPAQDSSPSVPQNEEKAREQGPKEQTDIYLDQIDNDTETTYSGEQKAGSAQCSPTSIAMALLGLCGDAGFRAKAETLFLERGLDNGSQWFQDAAPEGIVWDYIYTRSTAEWSEIVGGNVGSSPHTFSAVQATLLEEFTGASATVTFGNATAGPTSYQSNFENIQRFPAVASTGLTGSGHVVTVLSVSGDGVVVHDPYGAHRPGGHLLNGTSGEAPPAHRWQFNPSLIAACEANETRADWGQNNFFNWSEVETYQIGRRISAVEEAATPA